MKSKLALVALALASPGLAGCQGLFGQSGSSRVASADVDLSDYFAERVAVGKAMLDRGQYGAALVAFRQARLHQDFAAEAYNGMAVAYARLGRADLAERFFLAASAVDPANPRYLANLQKLQDQAPVMAAAAPAAPAPVAQTAPAPLVAVDTGRTVIRFGLRQASLVRDGAKDVHLVTAQTPETKAASASAPAVQVAARAPQAEYPVRTALTRRPATVHIVTTGNAASYPQRVALGSGAR